MARGDKRENCRIIRIGQVEKHRDAGWRDSMVAMSRAMQMEEAGIRSEIIALGA